MSGLFSKSSAAQNLVQADNSRVKLINRAARTPRAMHLDLIPYFFEEAATQYVTHVGRYGPAAVRELMDRLNPSANLMAVCDAISACPVTIPPGFEKNCILPTGTMSSVKGPYFELGMQIANYIEKYTDDATVDNLGRNGSGGVVPDAKLRIDDADQQLLVKIAGDALAKLVWNTEGDKAHLSISKWLKPDGTWAQSATKSTVVPTLGASFFTFAIEKKPQKITKQEVNALLVKLNIDGALYAKDVIVPINGCGRVYNAANEGLVALVSMVWHTVKMSEIPGREKNDAEDALHYFDKKYVMKDASEFEGIARGLTHKFDDKAIAAKAPKPKAGAAVGAAAAAAAPSTSAPVTPAAKTVVPPAVAATGATAPTMADVVSGAGKAGGVAPRQKPGK